MPDLLEKIKSVKESFYVDLKNCKSEKQLEKLRIKYLSRNGVLNSEILKKISSLPADKKPAAGKEANLLKREIQSKIEELKNSFSSSIVEKRKIDLSLPGRNYKSGKKHPINEIMRKIKEIFIRLGFEIAEGPDIENEYYNFDALNFPKDHPAKDMHDTFYLKNGYLMRTHTSPVQIRLMEKTKPPFRYIMPGKVYRCDSDVSHSVMFHQVEGLVVGENVSFTHLKFILHEFARAIFDKDSKVRFRPSFFPFTEPSAEVDISCFMCKGKGCRLCKNSGWIEILGAGMVDPNVFKSVGIDTEKYTGYAFGMGVERIAMLVYGINDIRLLFENNMAFLNQF